MCLKSKAFYPKKAKEDIVCYKRLLLPSIPSPKDNDCFISPFYAFVWKLGEEYTAEKATSIKYEANYYGNWCKIENGYFHTFVHYKDCDDITNGLTDVIVKCIIPKGTYYYEGVINYSSHLGYASKHLKVIEVVKC